MCGVNSIATIPGENGADDRQPEHVMRRSPSAGWRVVGRHEQRDREARSTRPARASRRRRRRAGERVAVGAPRIGSGSSRRVSVHTAAPSGASVCVNAATSRGIVIAAGRQTHPADPAAAAVYSRRFRRYHGPARGERPVHHVSSRGRQCGPRARRRSRAALDGRCTAACRPGWSAAGQPTCRRLTGSTSQPPELGALMKPGTPGAVILIASRDRLL